MARPANQHSAAAQARALLLRSLPGSRRGTVRGHLVRAERIAESIWRRWRGGPYQWRLKHLRWLLVVKTADYTTGIRYRYWLTLRASIFALGREADWLPQLNGPWLRPTGQAGRLKPGRPPKLPSVRQAGKPSAEE